MRKSWISECIRLTDGWPGTWLIGVFETVCVWQVTRWPCNCCVFKAYSRGNGGGSILTAIYQMNCEMFSLPMSKVLDLKRRMLCTAL